MGTETREIGCKCDKKRHTVIIETNYTELEINALKGGIQDNSKVYRKLLFICPVDKIERMINLDFEHGPTKQFKNARITSVD